MSLHDRERTGGEEAIARTNAEILAEEEARLDRRPKPNFSLRHLQLLPSLPDNPFYNHDTFADNLSLGFGTDEPTKPDDLVA